MKLKKNLQYSVFNHSYILSKPIDFLVKTVVALSGSDKNVNLIYNLNYSLPRTDFEVQTFGIDRF